MAMAQAWGPNKICICLLSRIISIIQFFGSHRLFNFEGPKKVWIRGSSFSSTIYQYLEGMNINFPSLGSSSAILNSWQKPTSGMRQNMGGRKMNSMKNVSNNLEYHLHLSIWVAVKVCSFSIFQARNTKRCS